MNSENMLNTLSFAVIKLQAKGANLECKKLLMFHDESMLK